MQRVEHRCRRARARYGDRRAHGLLVVPQEPPATARDREQHRLLRIELPGLQLFCTSAATPAALSVSISSPSKSARDQASCSGVFASIAMPRRLLPKGTSSHIRSAAFCTRQRRHIRAQTGKGGSEDYTLVGIHPPYQ
jgi:hypothetical protein